MHNLEVTNTFWNKFFVLNIDYFKNRLIASIPHNTVEMYSETDSWFV